MLLVALMPTIFTPARSGRDSFLLLGLAVALGLTLALGSIAAAPDNSQAAAQRPDCPHQFDRPNETTAKQLREAVTCLIAFERRQADRRQLRTNTDLKRIAGRHTRVMLDEECFRHRCPGEQELERRIINSDYLRAGDRYRFAENLGCAQTPRAQVNAWMDRDAQRRSILRGRFRHLGVGAAKGSPQDGARGCVRDRGYATYTLILAWRER